MNLRALRTLLHIAEVGSFATAAGDLNMTLSAVSMQMKALEEELGVALFDRAVRPPKMTPLGRGLLPSARRMLAAEGELRDLCARREPLVGDLRLGFVNTASVRLLPAFLAGAAEHHERARFEIRTGLSDELDAQVAAGTLEAAVITLAGEGRPDLRYERLFVDPLVFAAHRDTDLRDIAAVARSVPFLQFRPASGIGQLIAQQAKRFVRDDAPPRIVLDSVEAIIGCVHEGLGFTLLPRPDIEYYATEAIRVAPPRDFTLERRMVLAARRGLGDADVAALANLLVAAARQPQAGVPAAERPPA